MILSDKIAIVTGGSRGIGKAIVNRFAELGATVYSLSRSEKSIESEQNVDWKVIPIVCDIRDEKQTRALFLDIKKREGHIDILVNNAGVMQNALLGMITQQSIQEQFETNVFAIIQMTQTVSRIMKNQKWGSIINLASIIGTRGHEGQTVYSATKGAVVSFTLSASKELANAGIRVNAIAPGTIGTELLKNISDEKMKEHLNCIKMGRIGTPEEVADLAVFLASDYSKYITGQIIGIDGGTII